jgi:hypothetical protein
MFLVSGIDILEEHTMKLHLEFLREAADLNDELRRISI